MLIYPANHTNRGVIYKKAIERDVDYEPTNAERRRIKRRQQMPNASKGFKPKKGE